MPALYVPLFPIAPPVEDSKVVGLLLRCFLFDLCLSLFHDVRLNCDAYEYEYELFIVA